MSTNHFPRLLKLARRTGDRLIVTDEAGGGEPMVILPLDEYELLIDEAFGPGEQFRKSGPPTFQGGVGGGRQAGVVFEETEAEDLDSDLADPIQLLDDEFDTAAAPSYSPIAGGGPDSGKEPDEADVDEEALKDLWQPSESVVEEKMLEKAPETPVKMPVKRLAGEEQFYLEPLD